MRKALSLCALADQIGYEKPDRALDEEFEIPLLIKRSQMRDKALLVQGRRTPYPLISNIVDTREKLLKATHSSSIEELYSRLTSPIREWEKAFLFSGRFDDHYERVTHTAYELGALKYYEKDRGFYITSGIVVAGVDGSFNSSIHRMLVIDDSHLAIRIVPRQLYRVLKDYRSRGEELPVTILLGSHPLLVLTASTTPPFGQYEFALIPYFTGERMVGAKTPVHGNVVPVGPGIIVEAYITLEDTEEGPFVDAMGTYDRVRRQPVVRIEEVWRARDERICLHAILPGGAEHALLMGIPREAQIWSSVAKVVPRVVGVRLTRPSGGWLHAVISIEKNHEEDGKNAILAALAAHPSLKHVVVVDADIDLDDPGMIEWAIATRFQASRDLIVIPRARGSTLDPSAEDGLTSKMGLDATKPINASPTYERARIPGE